MEAGIDNRKSEIFFDMGLLVGYLDLTAKLEGEPGGYRNHNNRRADHESGGL
jgi:hypothetical protein